MIHLFQEKYKQGTYDSDRMEADIISLLYIPEPNISPACKLRRSYSQVFEAFILISVPMHIFYLITLGLTILKWGEPSL